MKIIPREVKKKKPITWSREIRKLQKQLKLNSLQKDVLIGTLLGDGSLVANAYGKNFRLQIEHSKKQKKYVFWKYRIFQNYCLSKPKFQPRTNSWKFRTISHPIFTEFRRLFYRGKNKILPNKISKILKTPRSLAVWFMDDGALGPGKRGLTLNTQNFTLEENQKLAEYLRTNFSLKTSLHKDKTSWRIYIFPESVSYFRKITKRFIFPEFQYKFSSSLTP